MTLALQWGLEVFIPFFIFCVGLIFRYIRNYMLLSSHRLTFILISLKMFFKNLEKSIFTIVFVFCEIIKSLKMHKENQWLAFFCG